VFSITTLDDDDSAGICLFGLINKSYNVNMLLFLQGFHYVDINNTTVLLINNAESQS